MPSVNEAIRTLTPLSIQEGLQIIDQTKLPHAYKTVRVQDLASAARAISTMQVRGAPLIGVMAAYGVALAMRDQPTDAGLKAAYRDLLATRPTAVNLGWALNRMRTRLLLLPKEARAEAAWHEADKILEEDRAQCAAIGEHGLALFSSLSAGKTTLDVMTHCNAGALATVGIGTALAPIYAAHRAGYAIHVWVSETRPRNQGLLTAWELAAYGIPHTVIADNAAGQLLASGKMDAVIVGADRIAANGDTANKVGTYLKALAAKAAQTPFYVAAPYSSIDFSCREGAEITIEMRGDEEVSSVSGLNAVGALTTVRLLAENALVYNPAFDVTPAAYVTMFITEKGCRTRDTLREE